MQCFITILWFHIFFSLLSFPSSVALMNHSCSPNVIVTYNGTVAEVRAVKEINPGEEVRKLETKYNYKEAQMPITLFILIDCTMFYLISLLLFICSHPLPSPQIFNSYIDLLYPTDDRKERLLDSYFFTCQCTECTTKSKVLVTCLLEILYQITYLIYRLYSRYSGTQLTPNSKLQTNTIYIIYQFS